MTVPAAAGTVAAPSGAAALRVRRDGPVAAVMTSLPAATVILERRRRPPAEGR